MLVEELVDVDCLREKQEESEEELNVHERYDDLAQDSVNHVVVRRVQKRMQKHPEREERDCAGEGCNHADSCLRCRSRHEFVKSQQRDENQQVREVLDEIRDYNAVEDERNLGNSLEHIRDERRVQNRPHRNVDENHHCDDENEQDFDSERQYLVHHSLPLRVRVENVLQRVERRRKKSPRHPEHEYSEDYFDNQSVLRCLHVFDYRIRINIFGDFREHIDERCRDFRRCVKNPDENHRNHHRHWDEREQKVERTCARIRKQPVLQEEFYVEKYCL